MLHADVYSLRINGNFHAEVVERGRWCEPFGFLALEACVDFLKESLDVVFISIYEAVVHIKADGKVPYRVPENAFFIFSTYEALILALIRGSDSSSHGAMVFSHLTADELFLRIDCTTGVKIIPLKHL